MQGVVSRRERKVWRPSSGRWRASGASVSGPSANALARQRPVALEAAWEAALAEGPISNDLRAWQIRCLIFMGSGDTDFLDQALQASEEIPSAQLISLEGLNHYGSPHGAGRSTAPRHPPHAPWEGLIRPLYQTRWTSWSASLLALPQGRGKRTHQLEAVADGQTTRGLAKTCIGWATGCPPLERLDRVTAAPPAAGLRPVKWWTLTPSPLA